MQGEFFFLKKRSIQADPFEAMSGKKKTFLDFVFYSSTFKF